MASADEHEVPAASGASDDRQAVEQDPPEPAPAPARSAGFFGALRRWPGTRFIAAAIVLLAVAYWLNRRSPHAAFVVAAETTVLTLEPLCGERLVWDLPDGRVTRRSAPPGEASPHDRRVGPATLVLLPGARARLESSVVSGLRVSVSHAQDIHAECTRGVGAFYEMTVGHELLAPDPVGVTYGAVPTAEPTAPVSLPLSGRVVIGDAVPLGAGWGAEPAGMLESATVDLRVKPWFDENRLTLRTERLERGSLLDTHACLAPRSADTPCVSAETTPAIGFVRVPPAGAMIVQLFSTGAVGAQSLGGEQFVIEIPRLTAALRSSALQSLASVLIVVFGLYQGGRLMIRDSLAWWKRKRRTTAGLVLLLAAAAPVWAEPVEVRQGTYVGAGYSFRRGRSCLVVTPRHVVSEMGVPVTVLDRTGARAEGSRAYENEFYDLALVSLPDDSLVACKAAWPDTAWLERATFSSRNAFRAVRHYTNGRETVVRLQHAGGVKHLLTLAPVDKLTIRESDSGSMVELDGRLVGMVQSVDPGTDRVNVLRFDTIDQLVGDRFRTTTTGPVSFVGVLQHGRANPLWSTYVQAWLTEKAGRAVLPAATGGRGGRGTPTAAPTVCEVKLDVLAWERRNVPNPAYESVALQLKACGRRGFVFEQTCAAGRRAAQTTPRQVLSHRVTLNTTVTPPEAPPVSKLETTTHVPPADRTTGRTEVDMMVLQAAAGPALEELLGRAGCP